MIFNNKFDNLTDEQIAALDEYFESYDYDMAGYTLLANYMWRNTHGITWQIIEGYLVISSRGDEPEETGQGKEEFAKKRTAYMFMPLTRDGVYDIPSLRKTVLRAIEISEAKGYSLLMGFVPERLLPVIEEAVGDIFDFSNDRDSDDYVYLREDLATLKGRKLHNKKNHLNQFLKTYEYTYEEITADNLSEVKEFISAKNGYILKDMPKKYTEILEFEGEAIMELLDFVDAGRLLTGVIRVGGSIVAVTIGEYANKKKHDNVIVHVEKADDRLRGLYQAINWEFVRRLPEDVIYVNREEDMGMPTLRQTKEGYKPHHMAKKYNGVQKNKNAVPEQ